MDNLQLSYEIFDLLLDCDKNIDVVCDIISTNNTNLSVNNVDQFKKFLRKQYLPRLKTKWASGRRIKDRFLEQNEVWLEYIYSFGEDLPEYEQPMCSHEVKRGRPSKAFEICQSRAKRSKVKQLCDGNSAELISSAAKKVNKDEQFSKMLSPEKALSLIIDACLSKHQYQILRLSAKEIGCDIFPSYHKVLAVKKECYPKNLEVQGNYSKASMQDLLDHTVSRIFKAKTKAETEVLPNQLQLISKWGCDGSSGHSEYHQKFNDPNLNDKNIFFTSIVPLNLKCMDGTNDYWRNTRPSSTTFCRPIKFQFVKETANVISEEVERVQNEIKDLKKIVVNINDKSFGILHTPVLTMIDGKVANTITQTS